jgi:hypothetical protein
MNIQKEEIYKNAIEDHKFSCKMDLTLTRGIELLMNLYTYN